MMDKNKYLIDLCESDRTEHGRIDFGKQSAPQRVFSAIWILESEVNNGGFDQYFRNSDSKIIASAPATLDAIGAKACSAIVAQAIQVIAPLPATEEGRHAALDALSDDAQATLSTLDTEFYAYPDDLMDLLFEYVSKHPKEFGPISLDGATR